jgi:lysophospholipase L1-like esterase
MAVPTSLPRTAIDTFRVASIGSFKPEKPHSVAWETRIGPPDGASRLLSAAMQRRPLVDKPHAPPFARTALAALNDATSPRVVRLADAPTAYGELQPDAFSVHRLTILQLGDSHTAADFFSGRVRERLQQAFGTGGDAYIVPGRPHIGVRSAVFDSDASDGWNYEALQRSDEHKKFYLSGFNAISRKSGAELTFRSRGGRAYDTVEVAFLKQPGGGRAEVAVDGTPAGLINLEGDANELTTLAVNAQGAGVPHGFHEIKVKALSDAPVTVTGVDVGRDGDGVSYLSLGFPGATVQLLQKLTAENIAADFRRVSPDVVVLAFGTNEGFNDNLDIAAYSQQYEQIVRRLQEIRPDLRIVIIGPPDAARPNGVCHAAGVGQDCNGAQTPVLTEPGGGQCRFPVPPKLNLVREAQRKLADKLGAYFWDWSSAQPGPCGAQIWAAANPPLMARDYVHMTLEGYKQSADRFADFLIPLIEGRQAGAHVVSNN